MNLHIRSALLSALMLSIVVCGSAAAGELPETGLGQSWPNAPDVSTRPDWHVYLFKRGNTHYVQVNDAQGVVRGAFARTPFAVVGLPIGTDATNLATPDEPLPPPTSKSYQSVYSGDGVQVFVAPQPNGSVRMLLLADCKDPVECSKSGP
jgi:hypothetical protein